MRTSRSNALIVDRSSLLRLVSKSSIHLVAYKMNLGVVPSAAEQGKRSVTEMMVTGRRAECSRQYALSVAKILKCLLSPERIDRYIVVSATVRSNRADKDSLALRTYIGWGNLAYVCYPSLVSHFC